ncbi:MAG: hypothetical protein RIF32_18285 [Leptospirales bacterium]|jgi:hypothetical protein
MWCRKRYRDYCRLQFARASRSKHVAVLGLNLYDLAERELKRDHSLLKYVERRCGNGAAVARLAEDIRTHGQLASIGQMLA